MAKKPTKRHTPAERRALSAGWQSAIREALPPTLTFRELWAMYLAALQERPGSSVVAARTCGNLYLLPAWGDMAISEITTPHVAAWVATLRPHMAAKYCLSQHSFLRAALELARARGAIAANPAARMPPGTLPPNVTRPGFDAASELPTLAEMRAILSAPQIPLYRRVRYGLTALTGARLGEISALRLRHLQYGEPLWSLTIEAGWVRDRKAEGPLKGRAVGSARMLPVHPRLLELLDEYRREGWWALYGEAMAAEDLLTAEPSRTTGRPKRLAKALQQWHADLLRLGMATRRFHALRHWFVSTLVAQHVEERTIRSMTHPATSADAFSQYAHTQYEAKCRAILTIDIPESRRP